jgi:hypothetical protein
MTDRELLERAAKAAGVEYENLLSHGKWNPLTDDGDALRLAVELSLTVDIGHSRYTEVWGYPGKDTQCEAVEVQEPFKGAENVGAATRRAIVRAAAAMVQT